LDGGLLLRKIGAKAWGLCEGIGGLSALYVVVGQRVRDICVGWRYFGIL
jgi:hypothetical protein